MASPKATDAVKKTSVGGQALIEGLLMIGPRKVAIAVRKPDGEIELKINPLPQKSMLQKIPIVRGGVNLFRQMKIGIGALMYSAEFFDVEDNDAEEAAGADAGGEAEPKPKAGQEPEHKHKSERKQEAEPEPEPERQSRFERFLEDKFGDRAKDVVIYFAVALSLCFSIGLFMLLPNFVAGFLMFDKSTSRGLLLSNLCEGVIRVGLFLGYLALTSRMNEIRRLWQYHGAEHKTINCYEHGGPLTVARIREFSIKHPRCGTSFLFLVLIISILVFSLVDLALLGMPLELTGVAKVLFSLLVRLVMIPIVAGVAYEVIKLAGRYDNALTRIVSAPGLMFQRFTTREPDDSMLEVAIAAFESALSGDENEMRW